MVSCCPLSLTTENASELACLLAGVCGGCRCGTGRGRMPLAELVEALRVQRLMLRFDENDVDTLCYGGWKRISVHLFTDSQPQIFLS